MILLPGPRSRLLLPSRRSSRRGTVALLILAILSVALLLVVTFTRTSKLEQVAASNYQRTSQSRIAAATGLPAASPLIPRNRGLVWTGQNWNRLTDRQSGALDPQTPGSLGSQDMVGRSVSGSTAQGAQVSKERDASSGGHMAMRDLAGSVNVNFVRSDLAFRRFLEALLGDLDQTPGTVSPRRTVGQGSLIDFRRQLASSPIALPGQPVETLSQLLDAEIGGLTSQTLPALTSHLTVFSLSPEVFNRADGTTMPKALWQPAQASHTLSALRRAFPDKSFRLLAQIAADLQDVADNDGLPTMIADPEVRGLAGLVLGKGGSLRITEVYPDSETAASLGDAGQFLEIWNGTSNPVPLDGWTVGVAVGSNATTPTERLPLTGALPPGAYLVVTDNFDSPNEFAPAGTGSFLSIFGSRGDGVSRFGLQVRSLDLPDTQGTVALFDPAGRMADVFFYGDGVEPNGRKSYQRPEPHNLLTRILEANPFRRPDNTGGDDLEAWKLDGLAELKSLHPSDLLAYDFRWTEAEAQGQRRLKGSARMKLGTSTADELDQSVLDVFSAPSPHRLHVVRSTKKGGSEGRFAMGRLNLNTCHRLALLSLDDTYRGMSLLDQGAWERIERHRQTRLQAGQVPFRNSSDVLPLVLNELPQGDERECVRILLDQVSVGSASFEVVAEYVSAAKGIGRRPSVSRQRWVVAYDQEPRRVVDYDPLY